MQTADDSSSLPVHTWTLHPKLPRLKHLANHVNVPDLSCQCESLLSSLQLWNAEWRAYVLRAPNHLTARKHQVLWF
jgi:hypothetical protein